ncbi:biotin-protein ligase [Phyllosticta capitalensis]
MASKRTNVLMYSGECNGSTIESVRHCTWTLRRLLSPNYAVVPVDGNAIVKEPWTASCALLVMPGGADLAYCRTLDGEGNRRISQYVNLGGNFIGFCAGGYYGCSKCEFEVGHKGMEVIGDRELGFFPGICRGLAFPGFVYHSEAGARATELKVNKDALSAGGAVPDTFRSYYNGGGVFVDAEKFKDRGVEILASYTDDLHVDSGDGKAAVVYRKIGEGNIILTGPHPEFAAANLSKGEDVPEYVKKVIEPLAEDDKQRVDFLKACLTKLGLKVNQEPQAVPSLSRLHLSSSKASDVSELVSSWNDIITLEDGEEHIKGENDTFHLEKPSQWSMSSLAKAVTSVLPGSGDESKTDQESANVDRILDYDKVVKRLVAHEADLPSTKETPYWNHHSFFANLEHYNRIYKNPDAEFGKYLLYGEVVTSTNTILEKNPKLLKHLPNGFAASATTQIAGRGRGSNVWVSPPGALIYSLVLRHSVALSATAPVVFIQYVAAMATVHAVHTYEPGNTAYSKLPVKLKWPNDIYALDPSSPAFPSPSSNPETRPSPTAKDYVKIGGVLVNSSFQGSEYTIVPGIGVNLANAAPTTSLNALARSMGLPPFAPEKLLARTLSVFESLYSRFCREGWAGGPGGDTLEALYYAAWLHAGQVVTLEAEGGVRARVKGITRDWGMLMAEELGWEDRPTGKVWELMSDSNSFDFMKGLVRRKT